MTDYSKIDIPVFDFKVSLRHPIGHLPAGTLTNLVRIEGKCYYLHFVGVADETFGWPHYTTSRMERAENNVLGRYYNRAATGWGWPKEHEMSTHVGAVNTPLFDKDGMFVKWVTEDVDSLDLDGVHYFLCRICLTLDYPVRGFFPNSRFSSAGREAILRDFHDAHFPLFAAKPTSVDPVSYAGLRKLRNEAAAALAAMKEGKINMIKREDVDAFRVATQGSIGNMLDSYQEIAGGSAFYPGKGGPQGLIYVGLKLNGEAGEFAEHLGKAMRDDGFALIDDHGEQNENMEPDRKVKLIKELGDILWYVQASARELGVPLSMVALGNLEKLCDRGERDKLSGSGDDR